MGRLIALDASVVIYHFERHPSYIATTRSIFERIERGNDRAIFSVVGMIEVLTGPKQRGELKLAQHYQDLLERFPNLSIEPVYLSTVDVASDLRARYKLTTADAIHLAGAILNEAEQFITNDRALKKVKEIDVQLVSDLGETDRSARKKR